MYIWMYIYIHTNIFYSSALACPSTFLNFCPCAQHWTSCSSSLSATVPCQVTWLQIKQNPLFFESTHRKFKKAEGDILALRLSSYCWNTEDIFFLIAWRKISEWQGQKQHFQVYWSLCRSRLAWFTVGTGIAYGQWYFWVHSVWVQALCSWYDLAGFFPLVWNFLNIFHLKEQQLMPLILMN